MPRTAFTASEWQEFNKVLTTLTMHRKSLAVSSQRQNYLKSIREFCENDKEAMDLWVACQVLALTESMIFHELEERLLKHLWANSKDYRDFCEYRQECRSEEIYFRGFER